MDDQPPTRFPALRPRPLLMAAALLSVWQLWLLARFYRLFIYDEPAGRIWGVADDVYISAAFGRTLVAGQGFLWYPGAPHVEGVTNPLWCMWIGALHWLPGVADANIGLCIVISNAVLLSLFALLFCGSLWHTPIAPPAPAERSASLMAALPVVLCLPCLSLPYWSAEGFEVTLIACLAFAMLWLSSLPETTCRTLAISALLGAGMVTRMDFVWVAIPAGLVQLTRPAPRARRWTLLAVPALVTTGAALLVRHSYFGDWFPNTYYLKATGWPLAQRWHADLQQNASLLQAAAAVWLPLLLPAVRRQLRGRASAVVGSWLAFTVTVLYSTQLGGDSWKLRMGYDRHTVVGGVLLFWGLAALVASCSARWYWRGCLLLWALALAAWPTLRAPRIASELRD